MQAKIGKRTYTIIKTTNNPAPHGELIKAMGLALAPNTYSDYARDVVARAAALEKEKNNEK